MCSYGLNRCIVWALKSWLDNRSTKRISEFKSRRELFWKICDTLEHFDFILFFNAPVWMVNDVFLGFTRNFGSCNIRPPRSSYPVGPDFIFPTFIPAVPPCILFATRNLTQIIILLSLKNKKSSLFVVFTISESCVFVYLFVFLFLRDRVFH